MSLSRSAHRRCMFINAPICKQFILHLRVIDDKSESHPSNTSLALGAVRAEQCASTQRSEDTMNKNYAARWQDFFNTKCLGSTILNRLNSHAKMVVDSAFTRSATCLWNYSSPWFSRRVISLLLVVVISQQFGDQGAKKCQFSSFS